MTEQAFIDSIDCRFPYTDRDAGRQLVFEACCLSANAAFAVLNELARPGVGADAPVEVRQELISLLEDCLEHPSGALSMAGVSTLAPILVPVARRLVAGDELSVPEAVVCMQAIRSYSGQYAALSLAYMSCDDVAGEADALYKEIMNSWRMNIELIEKSLTAIREDLLAFKAQGTEDLKKLADLAIQKVPMADLGTNVPMWRNYQELWPYMTTDQKSRAAWIFCFPAAADVYLRRGPSFQPGKDALTGAVTRLLPRMLADLDDLAENLRRHSGHSPLAEHPDLTKR